MVSVCGHTARSYPPVLHRLSTSVKVCRVCRVWGVRSWPNPANPADPAGPGRATNVPRGTIPEAPSENAPRKPRTNRKPRTRRQCSTWNNPRGFERESAPQTPHSPQAPSEKAPRKPRIARRPRARKRPANPAKPASPGPETRARFVHSEAGIGKTGKGRGGFLAFFWPRKNGHHITHSQACQ